jgi:hypothetical protein
LRQVRDQNDLAGAWNKSELTFTRIVSIRT